VQDELLERTRDLRDYAMFQDSTARDLVSTSENLERMEKDSKKKDKKIQELEKAVQDLEGDVAAEKAAGELELAKLQAQLDDLEAIGDGDRHYAEMCHRLSFLLQVPTTEGAHDHAGALYTKVETLVRERQQGQVLGKSGAFGASHHTTGSPYGYAPQLSGPYHHEVEEIPPGGPEEDPEIAEWLRSELRRSEQRMARLLSETESLKRNIAAALGVDISKGAKINAEALVSAVEEAAKGSSAVGRSQHLKASRGRSSPIKLERTSRDHEGLKRRLKTALETIESQDSWIDLLNRKIE
jgi:exonuclease VII small subunit